MLTAQPSKPFQQAKPVSSKRTRKATRQLARTVTPEEAKVGHSSTQDKRIEELERVAEAQSL